MKTYPAFFPFAAEPGPKTEPIGTLCSETTCRMITYLLIKPNACVHVLNQTGRKRLWGIVQLTVVGGWMGG